MLPARFSKRLREIGNDRSHGAIELAIEVVEAFERLSRSEANVERREISSAIRSLADAQPAMVPIRNAAEICREVIVEGKDATAKMRRLRALIEESRHQVAVNAASILPPDSTVVTLSRSSTVIEALSMAAEKGRVRRLYVMESRPRLEGRTTARALARRGVECVLVADAEGPSIVRNADMAVVGADAVLRDGGVVNKVGTFPLSLACRDSGRMLCVLAESIKLDRRFDSKTWRGPERRDESELLPREAGRVSALNVYFDLTAPSDVDCVVHEGGVSKRGWARAMERVFERMTALSR